MTRSTSYDLKNAKVGDEVVYAGKISKVARIGSNNVWLENGTRWTDRGAQYGSGGSWNKKYAYVILDRAKYDAAMEAARVMERLKQRREKVASIDRDQVGRMTDDEVLEIATILAKVQERKFAYILGKFAQQLFAPSHY